MSIKLLQGAHRHVKTDSKHQATVLNISDLPKKTLPSAVSAEMTVPIKELLSTSITVPLIHSDCMVKSGEIKIVSPNAIAHFFILRKITTFFPLNQIISSLFWGRSVFNPGTCPTDNAHQPPLRHFARGRSPTYNQTFPTRTGIGAKISW